MGGGPAFDVFGKPGGDMRRIAKGKGESGGLRQKENERSSSGYVLAWRGGNDAPFRDFFKMKPTYLGSKYNESLGVIQLVGGEKAAKAQGKKGSR